jgi:hypothetical protein
MLGEVHRQVGAQFRRVGGCQARRAGAAQRSGQGASHRQGHAMGARGRLRIPGDHGYSHDISLLEFLRKLDSY